MGEWDEHAFLLSPSGPTHTGRGRGAAGKRRACFTPMDMDDDAADVWTCRICMEEEPIDSPSMVAPCACSGSVRYVHRRCLAVWISTNPAKNLRGCSTCSSPWCGESEGRSRGERAPREAPFAARASHARARAAPVSYTHLTLPTIPLV